MTFWVYLTLLVGFGITVLGVIGEIKDEQSRNNLFKMNIVITISLVVLRIVHWLVLINV